MDEQVNIPVLRNREKWWRSSESPAFWRNRRLKGVGLWIAGKSTIHAEPDSTVRTCTIGYGCKHTAKKNRYALIHKVPVPQTDTRGQVENTKALEWFTAKELGKIVM